MLLSFCRYIFPFIHSRKCIQSNHLNLVAARRYILDRIYVYKMINDTAPREMNAHFEKTIHIERKGDTAKKLYLSSREKKRITFRVKILLEAMHNNDTYHMNLNVECSTLFLSLPFRFSLFRFFSASYYLLFLLSTNGKISWSDDCSFFGFPPCYVRYQCR